MKAALVSLLAAALCAGSALPAAAGPVADSALFRLLEGKWEGKGEMTDADGNKTVLEESWTGTLGETGTFIIKGRRTIDQQEHEFSWEFYPNGDLIEGQMKILDLQVDARFEVTVAEETRTITLKVPLDSSGSLLTVVNTVSEDGSSISGTAEAVDPSGQVTLTADIAHARPGS